MGIGVLFSQHLSILQVVFLEGRKMAAKQEKPRWADAYTGFSLSSFEGLMPFASGSLNAGGRVLTPLSHAVPGQFVAIKRDGEGAQGPQPTATRLHALASSPYAVHRESADLDASIIEVILSLLSHCEKALKHDHDHPAME